MCIHRERWTCTHTPPHTHTHGNILYGKITKEKFLDVVGLDREEDIAMWVYNTEHLKPGGHTGALRNRCVLPVRISEEAGGIGADSREDGWKWHIQRPQCWRVDADLGLFVNYTKAAARHFNSNLKLYTGTHSWWTKTININNGNIKGEEENIGKWFFSRDNLSHFTFEN